MSERSALESCVGVMREMHFHAHGVETFPEVKGLHIPTDFCLAMMSVAEMIAVYKDLQDYTS